MRQQYLTDFAAARLRRPQPTKESRSDDLLHNNIGDSPLDQVDFAIAAKN